MLTKTLDNMSSFPSLLPPIHTPPLVLLLLLTSLLPHAALSQNPGGVGASPPAGPTMADCGTRLLPLVPCAPFVQGTAPSPARPCCDGLKQLNIQQPTCLCLLLNNTDALSSFPINSTLALELPLLCNLQFDTSSCSGVRAPSSSPVSQVSPGVLPNGSIAAADTPGVTVAPKTSIMGIGFGRSGSSKLNMKGCAVVLVAATAFMSLDVQLSPP
ncbi:hypothetical protein RHMOL_Rhmol13G0274400 [Rhododendron molle]|uniref:Uncharacterized protein n=1 Tax=Rhododendron molle TaxID=49168 RepID=A0ACC0LCE2_RHOML|nr:hypothetical protein RHMOL_Rhmol13G0274400 [Rhododendron molle]